MNSMKINVKEYQKALELGWRLVRCKHWLEDEGEVYYTFQIPIMELLEIRESDGDTFSIIGFDSKKDYSFNTAVKYSGINFGGLICEIKWNGVIGWHMDLDVNVGNKALQHPPYDIAQTIGYSKRFHKLFKIQYGFEESGA